MRLAMSNPIGNNKPNIFNLIDCQSNGDLMSKITDIHESFKYIGFDDGINTAYQVALESLDNESRNKITESYGGKLDRVTFNSFDQTENKIEQNKRYIQVINAVLLATENDPLEEMHLSIGEIAKDFA